MFIRYLSFTVTVVALIAGANTAFADDIPYKDFQLAFYYDHGGQYKLEKKTDSLATIIKQDGQQVTSVRLTRNEKQELVLSDTQVMKVINAMGDQDDSVHLILTLFMPWENAKELVESAGMMAEVAEGETSEDTSSLEVYSSDGQNRGAIPLSSSKSAPSGTVLEVVSEYVTDETESELSNKKDISDEKVDRLIAEKASDLPKALEDATDSILGQVSKPTSKKRAKEVFQKIKSFFTKKVQDKLSHRQDDKDGNYVPYDPFLKALLEEVGLLGEEKDGIKVEDLEYNRVIRIYANGKKPFSQVVTPAEETQGKPDRVYFDDVDDLLKEMKEMLGDDATQKLETDIFDYREGGADKKVQYEKYEESQEESGSDPNRDTRGDEDPEGKDNNNNSDGKDNNNNSNTDGK